MLELLILLRSAQLFTHSAHNLCARTPFHQDHAFFADSYSAFEDAYDGIIERIIGIYGEESVNLNTVLTQVCEKLKDAPSTGVKENKTFYEYQLKLEKELCEKVESICKNPKATQGIIQTVATLGEQSEIRQYKIKQRIK